MEPLQFALVCVIISSGSLCGQGIARFAQEELKAVTMPLRVAKVVLLFLLSAYWFAMAKCCYTLPLFVTLGLFLLYFLKRKLIFIGLGLNLGLANALAMPLEVPAFLSFLYLSLAAIAHPEKKFFSGVLPGLLFAFSAIFLAAMGLIG